MMWIRDYTNRNAKSSSCVKYSYVFGYEFFESVDMIYKFHHSPELWSEALKVCRQENATLAMPANEEERSTLINIFNRYPASVLTGTQLPDYLLIGFHDFFVENEYVTETGLPIQYFYHKWLPNQPDNSGNEDCGSLYRTGFLNDYPCHAPAVFICQRKLMSGITLGRGECIAADRGYILSTHLGSLYKLHTNIKSWGEARTICESEGGYLAIINSVSEKDFLLQMFHDPDNRVLHAIHKDFVLLGFHDYFKEGEFVTVEGDLLHTTGYSQWGGGQPDNSGGSENCGSMHTSGVLNDFPCQVPAVFICEKKVSISNTHL